MNGRELKLGSPDSGCQKPFPHDRTIAFIIIVCCKQLWWETFPVPRAIKLDAISLDEESTAPLSHRRLHSDIFGKRTASPRHLDTFNSWPIGS